MNELEALLQLMATPGIGSKTLGRILRRLQPGETLAEYVTAAPPALVEKLGLRPVSASAVAGKADEAKHLAEKLREARVMTLALGREGYPPKLADILGDGAPPVLFARGNLAVMDRPAVGFCGSRNASALGIDVTNQCAGGLAKHGANIISGHARGVDLAAHRSALRAAGATTLVLPEGILQFKPRPELKGLIEEGLSLVVSEFPPTARWQARMAMQRNRTICALSDVVVLIESGLKGGTFNAGQTAMALGRALFVVDFARAPASAEGNAFFLERGARPLRRSRGGRANINPLLAATAVGGKALRGQASLSLF